MEEHSGNNIDIQVLVDGESWTPVSDFAASGPDDRHYRIRSDDGVTSVAFGDGTAGRRLPDGDVNVTMTYRVGVGTVEISLTSKSPAHAEPADLWTAIRRHTDSIDFSFYEGYPRPEGGGGIDGSVALRRSKWCILALLLIAVTLLVALLQVWR